MGVNPKSRLIKFNIYLYKLVYFTIGVIVLNSYVQNARLEVFISEVIDP